MPYKVANNVWATMPGTVAPGDASFALTAGHGPRFSFCSGANNYTWATLINTATTPVQTEVVRLTYSGSGDSVNVLRGQDGTTPLTISTPGAARLEVRIPRKLLEDLVHAEDLQTLLDLRAVTVSGTASAISSTHDKPLSLIVGAGGAPIEGMVSIFEPNAANDAAVVTYAPDGLVAKPVRVATPFGTPNGLALGDLTPGQKAVVVFDASSDCWLLINPANRGFALTSVFTSAMTVTRGFHSRVVRMNGTFTVSFSSASSLGSDFWCVIDNIGTGLVTLDANGSEIFVMANSKNQQTLNVGHGAVMLIADGSGTGFRVYPIGQKVAGMQVFNTVGTHTWRPSPMTTEVSIMCVGGGGGGGGSHPNGGGGGGGGGGAIEFVRLTSGWSGQETVTVGSGNNGGAVGVSGQPGQASSVGSLVTAAGGAGGATPVDAFSGGIGGLGGASVNGAPGGRGKDGLSATPRFGGDGGWAGTQGTAVYGGRIGLGGVLAFQAGGIGALGNGGGGGAGIITSASQNAAGGNGGHGLVIIWEY